MGSRLCEIIKRKNLKNVFKKENLIVMILIGILLFIITLPTKGNKTEQTNLLQANNEREDTFPFMEGENYNSEEYTERLEKRLREALMKMDGVGQVRVMITLKTSEELVVEKEKTENTSTTTEMDSQGGSRNVDSHEKEEAVVYHTEGNKSDPYVVKTYFPKVEGVLVVAQGAGSGTVNRSISEIVQALFGVEAHKIRVVKMQVN